MPQFGEPDASLPEKILTNQDLERMVETSNEWIMSRTGIRERHVAREDEFMSTFATRAAEGALRSAGLQGSDLDLVICATVTPDSPLPATACIVQNNLGANGAAAFDMSAGCSGIHLRAGHGRLLHRGRHVSQHPADWR